MAKSRLVGCVLVSLQFFGCFLSRTPVDDHPFSLNPEQVEEFTILGHDSGSNSPWLARLNKKQGTWELDSISTSTTLSDHRANETLILHLLDSLGSVQIHQPGPSAPLGSLGLAPPQFALRWRTPTGSQEMKIGNPSQDRSQVTISRDDQSTWLASGTFFSLLRQIQSWQDLRAPTWITESPDDIEELTIQAGKKTLLYAQRDGDHWGDVSHRAVKKDVDLILDSLIHHSWKKIIESTPEASALQKILKEKPDYSITLSGRLKHPLQLVLKKQGGTLYGLNQARPGCVFILNEAKLEILKRL